MLINDDTLNSFMLEKGYLVVSKNEEETVYGKNLSNGLLFSVTVNVNKRYVFEYFCPGTAFKVTSSWKMVFSSFDNFNEQERRFIDIISKLRKEE